MNLLGLLLVPLCLVTAWCLYDLLWLVQPEVGTGWPLAAWWMLSGFGLWVVLWFVLPRPLITYVLAHELTHALWALVFGARISGIKVSRAGGHVEVSRTNVLITLAPYFFPLYTVLVIALRLLLGMFWEQSVYEPFWFGLVGVTWGFHLTFTLNMIGKHQPDIVEYGRFFSYFFILLMNLVGICLWVVAVGDPSMDDLLRLWFADAEALGESARGIVLEAWEKWGR